MDKINFYRGERQYCNEEHNQGIYFATDTNEILTGGESFGKNADASIITEDIIVAGGPLADDITSNWPEAWVKDGNKVIPAGLTVQSILRDLFLKPVNGTVSWGNISWSPSLGNPTVTLSSDGPAEIGSTVTCTVTPNSSVSNNTRSATLTASQGYFESTDGTHKSTTKTVSKTGSTSGTLSVAHTWNGVAVSNFSSGSTALKIKEGTNEFIASQSGLSASVDALPETTVYASTNTKTVLPSVSATLKDSAAASARTKTLSSSKNDTITGYYRWNAFVSNSIDITKTDSSWKFTNAKSVSSVTAPDQSYIVVMVPSGFTLQTASQMNLDFTGSFDTKDVTLTIGGGTDTHSYKMYYWKNTTGSNASVDNITIS